MDGPEGACPEQNVRRVNLKNCLRVFLAALLAAILILPAHATAAGFEDVPQDHWAAGEIGYVVERGLFNGVSATRFEPSSSLDWAMLSTVLHRYAGSPEASGFPPYTDVPEGLWYTDGVAWAYENRIFPIQSLNSLELGPEEEVRRAEFCIMLYNFARALGVSVPDGSTPLEDSPFRDMDWIFFAQAGCGAIYGEAETAMLRWAVPLGIMNGVSDTIMNPLGNITRAEAAAMLSRFDKIVLGGTEPPVDPPPVDPGPVESEPGHLG